MINAKNEAKKHLEELGALSVPNPTVAKAITMQRLMKDGVSEFQAREVIDGFFRK